jgi:5-methylcytosine-specific restriction endonuclease McrA
VAEAALDRGLDAGPGSERYQVVVHVDAAALADPAEPGQSALEDAVHVSAETSRRLACDATRVVMRHAGDGDVLDVGRRTRTIPPALRRALQARDRGCRFPGCGVRHAQGHHIHHWANGGPTQLDNLALLCRRHHRAVQEEGYAMTRDSDGSLHFTGPRGRPIPDGPALPAVPSDPVDSLLAVNRAVGLSIDARTSTPYWFGDRLDLGWAISVLHPAANPPGGRPQSF